jgi:hypothetical protein
MDGTESLPLNAACGQPVKRPRQNRVTPWGIIEATHHKGTLMGNRGDLHAPDGSLGRQWRSRRWISCLLDTGDGWKAPMDEPGRNYPLFFHDEAVALAAGHRPCGECRPDALAAFIEAWKIGHGMKPRDWIPLREIDRQLHHTRLVEMRQRRKVDVATLPDGVFVWCPTAETRPLIVVGDHLHAWSHGGYSKLIEWHALSGPIYQLTPSPIIATIGGGYQPTYSNGLGRAAIEP